MNDQENLTTHQQTRKVQPAQEQSEGWDSDRVLYTEFCDIHEIKIDV